MVFSSIIFIFRFLPIAMILYFLTPKKYRNFVLLIISLIFYSWGEPKYFVLMIASILVDYLASHGIEKNRHNKKKAIVFLLMSIVFNLGMLFFFKYMNFVIGNLNEFLGLALKEVAITLPLGISFYTFQTMSYTIDVYRGEVSAEKNIINFGAYVCLFPQLIAGPIVKYRDVNEELNNRNVHMDQINAGIRQFVLGLGRKVLLANNMGMLWSEVERIGFNNISTPLAWLGILAFAFQIYFDFSGYSLMAIGLGNIMGFKFPQNFNFPYISRSITEFWRRWHMTLGSWFREYVYIPLGGNRVSKGRIFLNLFVVWSLTGIWHGANYNFLLWGLFFFVLISVEKLGLLKVLDKHRIFSHCYTIFFLLIGWSIFAIVDMDQLLMFFNRLFIFRSGEDWLYYLRNYAGVFIISAIFSTPIIANMYKKVRENKWIDMIILMSLFLISVAYLVDSTYNPFLYFRF